VNTRPRIGVILSSGGIRGVYAHTGFMRALKEMGINVDAIAGCSAGAIVGGILASGTSLESWTHSLEQMKQQDFWKPDSVFKFLRSHLLNKGRGYLGLAGTNPALHFTQNNLSVNTFEECEIPFYSLAINIGSGEKTLFSTGELASRIVASAAVPILYEPVQIEGKYYSDGALIDFAPTDAICCKHDLDIVLVHHVIQGAGDVKTIEKIIQRPWSLMEILNHLLFRQKPWYLNGDDMVSIKSCPCGCGAMIIAIGPELPELRWPSIDGGDLISESAYAQALRYLSPYRQTMQSSTRESLQALVTDLNRTNSNEQKTVADDEHCR